MLGKTGISSLVPGYERSTETRICRELVERRSMHYEIRKNERKNNIFIDHHSDSCLFICFNTFRDPRCDIQFYEFYGVGKYDWVGSELYRSVFVSRVGKSYWLRLSCDRDDRCWFMF